jgi:hypothetical protein
MSDNASFTCRFIALLVLVFALMSLLAVVWISGQPCAARNTMVVEYGDGDKIDIHRPGVCTDIIYRRIPE